MSNFSPEVDAYIARAPEFAKPILMKVRELFHQACPAIEETIKWGVPFFEYRGVLGGMAAFRRHASFGFWKGRLLDDPHNLLGRAPKASMSDLKFRDLNELPPDDILLDYMRRAVQLNENDVKTPRRPAEPAPQPEVPEDFREALSRNDKALAAFEGFSPSHRREYVEWIMQAKRSDTRRRRLETAVEWLSEGRFRHWRYMKK